MLWTALKLLLLPLAAVVGAQENATKPALSQYERQVLYDRFFQTNLRGPRWTGNENQNTIITLVSSWMGYAGLEVELLTYDFLRWDPRWWSLSLTLTNGTKIGLPATGYWPYSGDSGLGGVTAPVYDVGTYAIHDTISQTSDNSTLMSGFASVPAEGGIVFFDNPSPTRNYSLPGYKVLGTGRDIDQSEIPELGNLTNPHWQSAKSLNFTELKQEFPGIKGIISQWVNFSDENAALQFLPNDGPAPFTPNTTQLFEIPSLYVGEGTGKRIRELMAEGVVGNATIVLDAPWSNGTSSTIHGHLPGTDGGEETLLVYTHSDGPTIVEENGPLLLLTIAEYFAQHPLSINLDFVITTGHMSGDLLDEENWMEERPEIMENAKAAVVCEHFGAIEWKDTWNAELKKWEYKPTGKLEPMWTMGNETTETEVLHQKYFEAFKGTSDDVRMAMVSPQVIDGELGKWYGAGGSKRLSTSGIPTIGIIPQPDYLWTSIPDGGWSRLDFNTVVEQIEIILRLVQSLDEAYVDGQL